MRDAIREPKQTGVQVLNIAAFRQNFCTSGNILPLSANYFPIYFFELFSLLCGKVRLNGDLSMVSCWTGGLSSAVSDQFNPPFPGKLPKTGELCAISCAWTVEGPDNTTFFRFLRSIRVGIQTTSQV
jgi:hypothetical protein